MGICCVKQHNQDTGEFKDIKKVDENPNLSKNNNESSNKVEVVPLHEEASNSNPMKEESKEDEMIERAGRNMVGAPPKQPKIDLHVLSAEIVSENPKVRELEEKLGPFKPSEPSNDSVRRETRGTAVLDNGAHYIGQW